jgi:hypothetical protein
MASNYAERDGTSSALLEQLVYIDNFMSSTTTGTPNLDVDGQLSLDLAAFADDSFIFPDAEKPRRGNDDNDDDANGDQFDHFEVNSHNGNGNAGKNADTADNHLHPHELSNLINKASPVEHSPNQNEVNSNIDHHHHLNRHQRGLHPRESTDSINGTHEAGSSLNILELPKVPVPPGAQSSLVAAGLSQNQIDLLAALVAQHQLSGTKLYHASPAPPPAATSNSGYRQSTVHQHNLLSNFSERSNLVVGTDHFRDNTPSSSSPATSSTSSTIQVKQEDSQGNAAAAHHNFSGFGGPMSLHQRAASYDGYNDSNSEAGGASELDKRRRNTAASARFRIKKKQKEKEMVSTILQLSDATRSLEMKILQLEMENKLLRNLVVERGSKRSEDELKQLKERAQLSGRNDLKLDHF